MEKILIVRLGAMGDVLHALPAIASLRATFSDASIGWAIEENWAELLRVAGPPTAGPRSAARPLVDHVHLLNTKRWRRQIFESETHKQVKNLRREFQSQEYDLAIDVQGSAKSAVVSRLSGAKRIFGGASPRETPAKILYTDTVAVSAEQAHVIDQTKELVRKAAAKVFPSRPWKENEAPPAGLLPRDTAAETWLEGELGRLGLRTTRFAIMNPGAGWGAKQWPAARYGEVARELAAEGIKTIVNVGPGESERELGATVAKASGGTAQPIACSIGQLVAWTRRASLFVGGDTGPMHLAAMLGVPVVALFGPTDPKRNGPYYPKHTVLRHERSVASYSHTREADAGLMSITAAEVVAAARRLV
jgi:lipopolysaccharide heptosyltransferase I